MPFDYTLVTRRYVLKRKIHRRNLVYSCEIFQQNKKVKLVKVYAFI